MPARMYAHEDVSRPRPNTYTNTPRTRFICSHRVAEGQQYIYAVFMFTIPPSAHTHTLSRKGKVAHPITLRARPQMASTCRSRAAHVVRSAKPEYRSFDMSAQLECLCGTNVHRGVGCCFLLLKCFPAIGTDRTDRMA